MAKRKQDERIEQLKQELVDLDTEIDGLAQRLAVGEQALEDARQDMGAGNVADGLEKVRAARQNVSDLTEVVDAKRIQREAKVAELAEAEADKLVADLEKLRHSRDAAMREVCEAAQSLRAAMHKLGDANEAIRQHVHGFQSNTERRAFEAGHMERVADWIGNGGTVGFEAHHPAGPLDPESWLAQEAVPFAGHAVEQLRERARIRIAKRYEGNISEGSTEAGTAGAVAAGASDDAGGVMA